MKIDSSVGSRVALGSQSVSGSQQSKVFERISYAFNVNQAKDTATVASQDKTQLTSLSKAMENSQSVANMMNLTQTALAQVENMLTAIKTAKGLFGDSQTNNGTLDAVLNNISDAKANVSSFVSNVIEPAINRNAVAMENLRASDSSIGDFNLANVSADSIAQQLLSNSDNSISAQVPQTPQAVLQLLSK